MKKIIGITAAVLTALTLAACSSNQDAPTTAPATSTLASTTVPTTSVATTPSTIAPPTPDPAVAEAARVAAEQEAAQSSAAAQSAADQSAANQAEADRVAAEAQAQAAADQSAADQAAAETTAPAAEWYDSRGWVSPETAQRALDAGIPWGGDVPGYLRCGTICGEEPTSGEVQMANGCAVGGPSFTPEMCAAQGIPWGGPERESVPGPGHGPEAAPTWTSTPDRPYDPSFPGGIIRGD